MCNRQDFSIKQNVLQAKLMKKEYALGKIFG